MMETCVSHASLLRAVHICNFLATVSETWTRWLFVSVLSACHYMRTILLANQEINDLQSPHASTRNCMQNITRTRKSCDRSRLLANHFKAAEAQR